MRRHASRTLLLLMVFTLTPAVAPALAQPAQQSESVVHLPPGLVGEPVLVEGATARLLRSESHLTTRTDSRELTPGHVQTLWWVIFNNPEGCATSPCGLPDLFVPEVEAACLAADGGGCPGVRGT